MAAETATPAGESASTSRTITLQELSQHTTEKSCWLLLHAKVYDITDFLEEHPGGFDIILSSTGKDATQDFEEIGHSNSARGLLKKYLIGTCEEVPAAKVEVAKAAPSSVAAVKKGGPSMLVRSFNVLLPVLLLLIAVALNFVFGGKKTE